MLETETSQTQQISPPLTKRPWRQDLNQIISNNKSWLSKTVHPERKLSRERSSYRIPLKKNDIPENEQPKKEKVLKPDPEPPIQFEKTDPIAVTEKVSKQKKSFSAIKSKSIPRSACKKKPKKKEEPLMERLKQKSRPVFLAQDYDYCFTIMEGNNSQLVRYCMETRKDYWKEVPLYSTIFHFKWQPFSKGIRFEQLSYSQRQMVNHFEFHHEITTKDLLFRNMLAYSQLNKLNVFDFVPLTFVVDLDAQTYNPDLEKFNQSYHIIESQILSADHSNPNWVQDALKLINLKLQNITFSKDRRAVTHCKAKMWDSHFAGKNVVLFE